MSVDRVTNVLLCGIGGQGVLTAAELLARAAIAAGHDVKKTEVAGMAQRGGVVTSHLRFGPRVLAPAIPDGETDLLIGFEAAEALRWIGQVRAGGRIVANALRVKPPVVHQGLFAYPDDPIGAARAKGADRGIDVRSLDARAIADDLGNMKLINTAMLGAVADLLPLSPDALRALVVDVFRARKPALADLNAQAFDAGRAAVAAEAESAPAAAAS
ncbi:indolepyruvate oxidoreductase subunit beta [Roseospira marina]|uniref:Indolepyruvate oxidoreductase subunit beta n=1 Tax=Roseospira marina TaxID=140057 RepID=A0A5M6IE02_9PROT|nr:indolepyruvate oxidoreductase subunit beta [Roseospira marina]KAA5606521.1 indolepyruvate oxidoreductase subunit beta [Roseospira marina]MBB4314053.1 indolepyruvate ferredoxin oxidoreductase beta subunit [Roseospira marina]MBB5087214.1 indolepyruvate ferredoxin oxidoreductase beta subunit [Roseospira marina]